MENHSVSSGESPVSDIEPIEIHTKVWGQKELIVRILNRHFTLLEDYGGNWPQWKVDSYPDIDIHTSLENANKELDALNYVARLRAGKPWDVQVIPMRISQFPHPKWTVLLWFLSALTLTGAAINWMTPRRPDSGYFASSLVADAIICYTIPVLAALGLVSIVQQVVARKRGTRAGPIVPIFDPSVLLWLSGISSEFLFWPFGILMITSLPRMSSRVYKNRDDLGFIALIPVVTMLVLGMVYWILGLILAPEQSIVTSAPHTITPTYFMQVMIPTDLISSSVWASPLVLAGACLVLMSWLNSLHIPGLPGGRLHVARRTSREVRDFWTFIFLISACFMGAVVYEVFERFSMWSMIIPFLAALLVLNGTREGIPFVLDEEKRLDNSSEFRMGLAWGLILLFALPAVETLNYHSEWDDEVEYSVDFTPIEFEDDSWNFTFTIEITNPSLLDKEWFFTIWDEPNAYWSLDLDCISEVCRGELSPRSSEAILVNGTWMSEDYQPTGSNFEIKVGKGYEFHTIEINSDDFNAPSNDVTTIESSDDGLLHCLDLQSNMTSNLTLEMDQVNSSLFSFMDNSEIFEISQGENRVCIDAREDILFDAIETFTLVLNESRFLISIAEDINSELVIPSSGWTLYGENEFGFTDDFSQGGQLILNGENCTYSPLMTPSMPQEGDWQWNLSNKSLGDIPSLGDDILTIFIPDDSNLLLCDNDFKKIRNFTVSEGPELVLNTSGEATRIWNHELIWQNFGNDENNFTIEIINPSDSEISYTSKWLRGQSWQHSDSNPEVVQSGSNSFSFETGDSSPGFVFLSYEDSELVFNFLTFEVQE